MTVRVAAIADLHMRPIVAGKFRPAFLQLAEHADVLLLAGDLTEGGRMVEAELLCAELDRVPIPMVGVLGNHDHDRKQGYRIAAMLTAHGVRMLEGDTVTLELAGVRVGIAGVMGGSGGYPGLPGDPDNANPEHRERMLRGPIDADILRQSLDTLDTDIRIALMHFSPVVETLLGEPIRIYPGLGCHELATAIDHGRADLALHGHAHAGTESGQTPGGVPVRNVSYPVLRRPYAVYTVEPTAAVA
ncbi:metallophosphoesterase [Nocardia sp. NPDC051832]|uniref:metallophosphoesterase family protein n=1 Tax=Nocardia sp. NPDC051832 TaxID=3155673 RepID=UPI0034480B6A